MADIRVRKATADDITLLIPRLAQSFVSQPLTKWVLGTGERAVKKGEQILRLDFQNALSHDLMYTTADLNGAALWYPPGVRQTIWKIISWIVGFTCIAGLSRRLVPQFSLFRKYEQTFPKVPHYYLSLLAVAPGCQGKGVGSALLEPVLQICDEEKVPAFTATDTELNVRFYEKHGFCVRDTIATGDAGVTVWTLFREPRKD
ncbi:MAG: GNAT family N-acetyltransferase [Candidatus Aureabacteria bacterium]|nr:GNAT family N-acetyltransferase [Candidatus Auribacterota bacterium]